MLVDRRAGVRDRDAVASHRLLARLAAGLGLPDLAQLVGLRPLVAGPRGRQGLLHRDRVVGDRLLHDGPGPGLHELRGRVHRDVVAPHRPLEIVRGLLSEHLGLGDRVARHARQFRHFLASLTLCRCLSRVSLARLHPLLGFGRNERFQLQGQFGTDERRQIAAPELVGQHPHLGRVAARERLELVRPGQAVRLRDALAVVPVQQYAGLFPDHRLVADLAVGQHVRFEPRVLLGRQRGDEVAYLRVDRRFKRLRFRVRHAVPFRGCAPRASSMADQPRCGPVPNAGRVPRGAVDDIRRTAGGCPCLKRDSTAGSTTRFESCGSARSPLQRPGP